MIVSYHKFKEGLVSTAAAGPDMVSLLEQITADSYTCHGVCPLMFQKHFPSDFIKKKECKQFAFTWDGQHFTFMIFAPGL